MLRLLSWAEPSALRLRTTAALDTALDTGPDTVPDTTLAALPDERSFSGPSEPGRGEVSVIGNDVRIIGKELEIISRGTLRLDGEIEGDVKGGKVILGEHAKVTGTIVGQHVTVAGKVSGVIRGNIVVLESSSQVFGDIHHKSLAIKEGARFKGRSWRATVEADLNAGGRHLSAEALNLAIKRLRAATLANQPMRPASATEDQSGFSAVDDPRGVGRDKHVGGAPAE